MIDYLGMVKEFHEKYKHYQGTLGVAPPEKVIKLRKDLIIEESVEFRDASYMIQNDKDEIFTEITPLIADAIADLLYVVFGAAIAYGIPIEEVFKEVHRSNMTKSGMDEFGKTLKGESYLPPDIKKILNAHKEIIK
jgi:predicted HAD superfamily Cof-like phosphohydrolase